MKKIIIILLSFILTACDKESILDMYLKNNCNEELHIVVHRNYDDEGVYRYIIPSNSVIQIGRSTLIHRRKKSEIPLLISKLDITKNGISIKINPLDTNRWVYEIITEYKLFKNIHHSKVTLNINPEDFE